MSKKYFGIAILLFIIFFMFTLTLMKVDVQPIGPNDSEVGLAILNDAVRNICGVSNKWDKITDVFKLLSIAIMGCFALLGAYQLVRGKSLAAVDKDIIILGVIYVLLLACEVVFDKFAINYRPILTEEGLEASFPSSHTLLIIGVYSTALIKLHRVLTNKVILTIADLFCIVCICLGVVGRILSGQHWITDIIGGIILGCCISSLYYALSLSVNSTEK